MTDAGSPERSDATLPEARGAFGGFIGPQNLMSLVDGTLPWLSSADGAPATDDGRRPIELADHPLGWWAILRAHERVQAAEEPSEEQWTDYFALCVAAHFATVMSYVPTDVDTKIRDRLWYLDRSSEELTRLKDLALALEHWDVSAVSNRQVTVDGFGVVSGHDGERLSVLCGGILGLLRAGDEQGAAELTEAVDRELRREAEAFEAVRRQRGREKDLLVLSSILTHNAGDVDQGLSARKGQRWSSAPGRRFGRLAHERFERYDGAFEKAAKLYKALMACEGHRNYPLREVRPLRSAPELLLPPSPFLDAWGERCATWRGFDVRARAEVVAALVNGVRKVPGQRGYQRALAGFDRAHPGGLAARDLVKAMPASVRRAVKDADLRREISVRQISFESSMGKKARALVGQ